MEARGGEDGDPGSEEAGAPALGHLPPARRFGPASLRGAACATPPTPHPGAFRTFVLSWPLTLDTVPTPPGLGVVIGSGTLEWMVS